ncbi:hypothetical protein [Streptomyces sp. AC512_CC834]|nr:hypothetical protein [Streptomyces sp. AC512_CC834]
MYSRLCSARSVNCAPVDGTHLTDVLPPTLLGRGVAPVSAPLR